MTYARDERLALCTLLSDVGPDQPTLCAGWETSDLAAHLILRERRPDAGVGILGGPLARYTRAVQTRLARGTPFPKMVSLIRTGPPRMSPFGLPGADERLNLVEFFVHHEDIRRAQPGWEPREISADLSEQLWKRLGVAKMVLRKAPVGVELVREDAGQASKRVRMTAKARTPVVTVIGTPAELTMWVLGRTREARVRLDGSDADIAALTAASWRL